MKTFFRNIIASILATLVLFSSMSFTIDKHYCGDTLVDTAIFKQAKTCGMEMSQSKNVSEDVILKKECCKNELIVKKGQDELNTSINSFSLDQQLFVASFIYSYLNLFERLDTNTIPFNEYSPPLIVKDIHVLDAVFLI